MKILLTGANGFIGNHLVGKLLGKGHELVVLKRRRSDLTRINQYVDQIRFYDFEDASCFDSAFSKGIDIVIHLAGVYIKEEKDQRDIQAMNHFNIDMSSNLLLYSTQHNVKCFINTGTFFEYNLWEKKPISEDSTYQPYDFYAVSKINFEQTLKYFCNKGKIRGITLKLFSPYGESDNQKVIPRIIQSFELGKDLALLYPNARLSFTYVGDIINAYLKSIEYALDSQFSYESFIIGSEKSHSIGELVDLIGKIIGKPSNVYFENNIDSRENDIEVHCNIVKPRKLLNWNPSTTLAEGLTKTINYYKKVI